MFGFAVRHGHRSCSPAPLLIGCDLGWLDGFILGLLSNDAVLAIGQDASASQP